MLVASMGLHSNSALTLFVADSSLANVENTFHQGFGEGHSFKNCLLSPMGGTGTSAVGKQTVCQVRTKAPHRGAQRMDDEHLFFLSWPGSHENKVPVVQCAHC